MQLAADVARQNAGGVRALKSMFRELEGSAGRVAYENEQLMRFQQHGHGLPRG